MPLIWRSTLKTAVPSKVHICDAVEEFLHHINHTPRRGDNRKRSDLYLHNTGVILTRLAGAFPTSKLSAIKHSDLEKWLDSLGKSARTVKNHYDALRVFYRYCGRMGFVPRGENAFLDLEPRHAKSAAPTLMTPEDMEKVCLACPPHLVPFLVLGAFAGIRPAERGRLDWSFFDFNEKVIRLVNTKDDLVTKTDISRIIEMESNLIAWLAPHFEAKTPILPVLEGKPHRYQVEQATAAVVRVAVSVGVKWEKGVLRDSYGSYFYGMTRDIARTTANMGNTPQIFLSRYKVPASKIESEKYFNIYPL